MTKSSDSVKPWSAEHHTILLQRVQSSQLPWIQFLTPEACINRGEQILISSPSWWQNWVPELQQDPTKALPWRWRTPTRNPGDRANVSPSVRICLCFHLRVSCFMWFVVVFFFWVWDVIGHLKTTFWPLPAFSWEFLAAKSGPLLGILQLPIQTLKALQHHTTSKNMLFKLNVPALQKKQVTKKRYSTSEQTCFFGMCFFVAVFGCGTRNLHIVSRISWFMLESDRK